MAEQQYVQITEISIHATLAGGDKNKAKEYTMNEISIHATLAGGDEPDTIREKESKIFLSTPPSRVATSSPAALPSPPPNFYPRHPRGWRRGADGETRPHRKISIHATLAGGDTEILRDVTQWLQFLSTPPSRVATGRKNPVERLEAISIHATLAGGDGRDTEERQQIIISIHATLAGGDAYCDSESVPDLIFLSTPPSRVATTDNERNNRD